MAAIRTATEGENGRALLERRIRWWPPLFVTNGVVPQPSILGGALGFRPLAPAEAALDLEAIRGWIRAAIKCGGADPALPASPLHLP